MEFLLLALVVIFLCAPIIIWAKRVANDVQDIKIAAQSAAKNLAEIRYHLAARDK